MPTIKIEPKAAPAKPDAQASPQGAPTVPDSKPAEQAPPVADAPKPKKGKAAPAPVDAEATYLVLHDCVGGHEKGAKVAGSEIGPGADLDRLMALGAIVPSGE